MANRRDLRDQVYARVGVDTADAMVTTPIVNGAINTALHFIETVRPWWWLESTETLATVAGTATVAIDAGCKVHRSLAYADGQGTLRQIAVSDLDDSDTDASRRPEQYALYGLNVILWPTPDAVYSITHRFIGSETDLSTDSASPLLPAAFHPALVNYAAHVILTRTHDSERAAEALNDYQVWESKMIDNSRREMAPKLPRIRAGAWL